MMTGQATAERSQPNGAASRAVGANSTVGLCVEERQELDKLRAENTVLKIWKDDALERIADEAQAYEAQAEMLRKMQAVIAKVADHLHAAKLEMLSVIEIKDEYAEVVKRSRKRKTQNVELTGLAPEKGD